MLDVLGQACSVNGYVLTVASGRPYRQIGEARMRPVGGLEASVVLRLLHAGFARTGASRTRMRQGAIFAPVVSVWVSEAGWDLYEQWQALQSSARLKGSAGDEQAG
ncbi:hypothetical protein [Actinosynnema sp. NPDC020468]|uniref:hypothetical protein n=1 Tax=Actinosynnema sp. NPDC020468 TaxID=3154488 RepID=UPI0033E2307E